MQPLSMAVGGYGSRERRAQCGTAIEAEGSFPQIEVFLRREIFMVISIKRTSQSSRDDPTPQEAQKGGQGAVSRSKPLNELNQDGANNHQKPLPETATSG
jgi:hypothetical protein